ncbi:hypothetical protein RRG08_044020 [Elysia crispata]|uniref:Uncharacterized protein n=1 Tax=Elysia crispata TaxID=231223 RepID=A0AAE1CQU7_9GAST|nr:hypothetical protein RRG08_044020 [Elysia crispata]
MEGGGWGLIIVMSAFMIQALTFGTTASVGIYNIELLDYFHNNTVGVSLIGSINFGVYLGSGRYPISDFPRLLNLDLNLPPLKASRLPYQINISFTDRSMIVRCKQRASVELDHIVLAHHRLKQPEVLGPTGQRWENNSFLTLITGRCRSEVAGLCHDHIPDSCPSSCCVHVLVVPSTTALDQQYKQLFTLFLFSFSSPIVPTLDVRLTYGEQEEYQRILSLTYGEQEEYQRILSLTYGEQEEYQIILSLTYGEQEEYQIILSLTCGEQEEYQRILSLTYGEQEEYQRILSLTCGEQEEYQRILSLTYGEQEEYQRILSLTYGEQEEYQRILSLTCGEQEDYQRILSLTCGEQEEYQRILSLTYGEQEDYQEYGEQEEYQRI